MNHTKSVCCSQFNKKLQVVTVNVNEIQNVLLDIAFNVIACIITHVPVTWRYIDQLLGVKLGISMVYQYIFPKSALHVIVLQMDSWFVVNHIKMINYVSD